MNSGIRTVDGNYVWLFQDATHANVVIGVIGTSDPADEPDESRAARLLVRADQHQQHHADLYTVQYVPLFHPDPTNPDDPDIDLSNMVFASVAGTISVNFSGEDAAPGIHDFYLINSPDDASKQFW